jgi:hypothetical protein
MVVSVSKRQSAEKRLLALLGTDEEYWKRGQSGTSKDDVELEAVLALRSGCHMRPSTPTMPDVDLVEFHIPNIRRLRK